jgi:Trypsin-like peptidase domain
MTEPSGAGNQPAAQPKKLKHGSLTWRIAIATAAHRFFGLIHDAEVATLIEQPQDAGTAGAWPVVYFSMYLQKLGFPGGSMSDISRILADMERLGLLLPAGWRSDLTGAPVQGQLFISDGVRSAQTAGHLWLSEVLGAELIIESYRVPTLLIGGGEDRPVATGLVLDRTHVVTNRHVIEGLAPPSNSSLDIEVHTSFSSPGVEPVTRQARIVGHPSVDVAVIEAEFGENEHLPALAGMVFRDPRWQDDVFVFGYPYVPGLTERPITVERGQVVNPRAEAAGIGGYPRQPTFLTSAIARPGNSGGPIVAQDGRVIGLVVENSREADSTAGDSKSPDSPPFYRGIPAGEVVCAIEYLGFTGIATLEQG